MRNEDFCDLKIEINCLKIVVDIGESRSVDARVYI